MRTFLFQFREGLASALSAVRQNKLRALLTTLGEVAAGAGGTAFEQVIEVTREGRTFDYALYGVRAA